MFLRWAKNSEQKTFFFVKIRVEGRARKKEIKLFSCPFFSLLFLHILFALSVSGSWSDLDGLGGRRLTSESGKLATAVSLESLESDTDYRIRLRLDWTLEGEFQPTASEAIFLRTRELSRPFFFFLSATFYIFLFLFWQLLWFSHPKLDSPPTRRWLFQREKKLNEVNWNAKVVSFFSFFLCSGAWQVLGRLLQLHLRIGLWMPIRVSSGERRKKLSRFVSEEDERRNSLSRGIAKKKKCNFFQPIDF